ncbi:MAG: hypothetical protein CMO01_28645 [Thalassobius sp.]|nr:hypothetical protein [Thalassovita sp.]
MSFKIIALGVFFALSALAYIYISSKFMSKKIVKQRLEEIIKEQYNNAWNVKEITRHFNEGNMNPNMFAIIFEDKANPEIQFFTYWDAKKEELYTYSFDENPPTLNDLYKKAIATYEMEEDIKSQMGDQVKNVVFEYNKITIVTDFEVDRAFMLQASKDLCKALETYPEDWNLSVNIYFTTLESNYSPFYVYITPDVDEPDAEISQNFNSFTFHISRQETQEITTLVKKVNQTFGKQVVKDTDNQSRLTDGVPLTWLHQENITDLYALFYIEKIPEKKHMVSPYVGFLVVKYNLDTEELIKKEMQVFEQLDFDNLYAKIENTLPKEYHVTYSAE